MASHTFVSPTLSARSALVRSLELVDRVEAAWTRRDWREVEKLVGLIRGELALLEHSATVMDGGPRPCPFGRLECAGRHNEAQQCSDLAADVPPGISESEERALWGDR